MKDFVIDRVEVFTVGPPTDRLAWAVGMEGQYMTATLLRATTVGGLTGIAGAVSYSERGYESSVAETLRSMAPDLIGRSALERETLWQHFCSKTLPRPPQAQSLIDVALWDMAAKAAGLPLYNLLGGARDKILAYASTPLLTSAEAYSEEVTKLTNEGFRAIKFHCWCDPRLDLPMVERVARDHGDKSVDLMLDVEQRYDRDAAMRVGAALGRLGYGWFEAPLDDWDLFGYKDLTQRLSVPIVPAGNSIVDPRAIAFALAQGCWSKIRVDVMSCGGITPALKIMALAATHGTTVEVQCWGYTLGQAANLHLMLGQPNCTYFEQPTPYEVFEFGARTVIRTDRSGYVHAPPGLGLGIELDWPAIEAVVLNRFECRA